ncbi:MAG: transcription initiation factor IIB [Thermoprotei archaeon]
MSSEAVESGSCLGTCLVTGGCHQPIYDHRTGSLICALCGLVLEENLPDLGKEWRSFSTEEETEKARVGGRITSKVHDLGLHTEIGSIKTKSPRFRRLVALNRKIRVGTSSKSRKQVSLLHVMNAEASRLGLPESVKETAGKIIMGLVDRGLTSRLSKDKSLVLATIYYAANINGYPLALSDLLARYSLKNDKDKLWKAMARVQEVMKAQGLRPKTKATNYIPQIVGRLGLSNKVMTKSAELLNLIEKQGLNSGKSNVGLSAAAVYLVSSLFDEKKTQKEVASVIGLTEVSIRNRYREIIENFDIIVKL